MRQRDQLRLYEEANCRDADPHLFFSEGKGTTLSRQDRRALEHVCGNCGVRDLCREMGADLEGMEVAGRWGGEPRQLRQGRNPAA